MEQIREILFSDEFEIYYAGLDARIREKYNYALHLIQTQRVVNRKFVKKLENTDFYELRVSVNTDEHRTILFAIDHDNFMECRRVLLLNAFLKKGTKQYKAEMKIAEHIVKKYMEE